MRTYIIYVYQKVAQRGYVEAESYDEAIRIVENNEGDVDYVDMEILEEFTEPTEATLPGYCPTCGAYGEAEETTDHQVLTLCDHVVTLEDWDRRNTNT